MAKEHVVPEPSDADITPQSPKPTKDGKTRHVIPYPAVRGPISLDQINDADRAVLQALVFKAKFVVDVGSWLGGSAETMLDAMPKDSRLVTIDNYHSVPGHILQSTNPAHVNLIHVFTRLERFGERATVMAGDSIACAAMFAPGIADMVFLDAAHDYDSVCADIEAWLPILKPSGILAGHDLDKGPCGNITLEEAEKRKNLDWDNKSGIHWGVIFAVFHKFKKVNVDKNKESSVWWVQPEWKY